MEKCASPQDRHGSGQSRFQPEGLSIHVEEVGVESEVVHQSNHHSGVLNELSSPGEGEVGGHDSAAPLTVAGDHLEQQLRLVAVETEVTQFIED